MRFVALCLLISCTSSAKVPPDREVEWRALEQRYTPLAGEWESVVRLMSVARRQAIDDPKTKDDVAKAMRSALADTDPTRVIPDVAAAKDLAELVDVARLLFDTATTDEDPLRLVALADDMRKRGTLFRMFVSIEILRAAASWSVAHKTKLPPLEAIQPKPLDFIEAVGREVVDATHLIEKDLDQKAKDGKRDAQIERQVKELHAFIVERMAKLEEKPTDVSHLRKHAHWRDEPDALDHPLIRIVAQNFGPRLDDFDKLQESLTRLRMGTLKPAVKAEPEAPPPACEKIVIKGIKGSGFQRELPKAEVDRIWANATCLADDARVVPFFVAGKCTGFKILSIAKGSIYTQLGLENGDIIEKLAGVDMVSPDNAIAAFEKVKASGVAELVVKRKEAQVTFTWRAK